VHTTAASGQNFKLRADNRGLRPDMPLRSGFRPGAACPLWLLDYHDITIIPLGNDFRRRRRQTNPIYSRPPGQDGEQLVEHCGYYVIANSFEMGAIDNMLFMAAEILLPEFELQADGQLTDVHGWVNIWQGFHPRAVSIWQGEDNVPPLTGTLYCAMGYDRTLCLCGSCWASWARRGWVCERLWLPRHRAFLGIEEIEDPTSRHHAVQ